MSDVSDDFHEHCNKLNATLQLEVKNITLEHIVTSCNNTGIVWSFTSYLLFSFISALDEADIALLKSYVRI